MAINPRTGFLPADPSQWSQARALPRIIVRPKSPSTGSSDNSAGADGIDDWFVPGTPPDGTDGADDWFVPTAARGDTPYPDDWFVPVPAPTPSTETPATSAQLNAANPAISNLPAVRPDPFAAYWSLIPASRVGAMAWHPPIFPDSRGQFPLPAPAPLNALRINPTQGLLGSLQDLPATNIDETHGLLGALANLPETSVPSHGLLGAIANLPSADPAAFPSLPQTGLASGNGDQFAPPSFRQNLANPAWSSSPVVLGRVSDADNYTVASDGARQFPFLDGVPFDAQPSDTRGATPPPLNRQMANASASTVLRPVRLASGVSDRSAPQSPPQNLSDPRQLPQSSEPDGAEDNLSSSPSAASPTDSKEPRSITRVVRDSTGRPLAIIHVHPAPSNASLSESDARRDVLHPGAKYAQINNAITGNPVIDRTTNILLAVLQESVLAMGQGWGPQFGTAVHTDFANRVRRLDLPGIGQKGVEHGFHLDIKGFVQYGWEGSIRTDVTLRDPRDPHQRPIAIYDLKTGNAVLTSGRVREILDKVNTPGVWIIELQYRTGNALDRTQSAPPR